VVDTQSAQTLKNKAVNVKTVWITHHNQLTYWTGSTPYTGIYAPAPSGQSIYQIPGDGTGTLYMIDPYEILRSVNSGITPLETSVTGFKAFAGVTVVMPSAAAPGNDNGVVGIGVGAHGRTSYTNLLSGATIVYVYPYGGAGTTYYGRANSRGTIPESIMTMYGANGTIGNWQVGTGVSYFELNKPGEITWFKLKANSQVSAYPVEREVWN
jgi:hypothetical protein